MNSIFSNTCAADVFQVLQTQMGVSDMKVSQNLSSGDLRTPPKTSLKNRQWIDFGSYTWHYKYLFVILTSIHAVCLAYCLEIPSMNCRLTAFNFWNNVGGSFWDIMMKRLAGRTKTDYFLWITQGASYMYCTLEIMDGGLPQYSHELVNFSFVMREH